MGNGRPLPRQTSRPALTDPPPRPPRRRHRCVSGRVWCRHQPKCAHDLPHACHPFRKATPAGNGYPCARVIGTRVGSTDASIKPPRMSRKMGRTDAAQKGWDEYEKWRPVSALQQGHTSTHVARINRQSWHAKSVARACNASERYVKTQADGASPPANPTHEETRVIDISPSSFP